MEICALIKKENQQPRRQWRPETRMKHGGLNAEKIHCKQRWPTLDGDGDGDGDVEMWRYRDIEIWRHLCLDNLKENLQPVSLPDR